MNFHSKDKWMDLIHCNCLHYMNNLNRVPTCYKTQLCPFTLMICIQSTFYTLLLLFEMKILKSAFYVHVFRNELEKKSFFITVPGNGNNSYNLFLHCY